MAVNDYFPTKDGDIVPWMENFIAVANANLVPLGLVAVDVTAVTTKKSTYSTNLNAAIAAQVAAKAATESKNIARKALEDNIRVVARQVQGKPGVPENLIEALGLNVHGSTPTPIVPVPPADLSSEVIGAALFRLKWNRAGNPQGVIFIIETGAQPAGPWQMVGTTTKTIFDLSNPNPIGPTFAQVKAQKGDLISPPSNVIVI